ncbi:hypothetical protein GCM10023166_03260 [Paeniglutamicibacter cryotolerans]
MRSATAADLPLIWRREYAYMLEFEPSQSGGWLTATDRNLHLWIQQLDRATVIESDGEVAGYSIWMGEDDEAVLITVQVLPAWRRRGLGGLLMDRFVSEADAAGHARKALGVLKGNPAEALYISAGFRHTHDEGGYRFMSYAS